jgi:hypothetical protein
LISTVVCHKKTQLGGLGQLLFSGYWSDSPQNRLFGYFNTLYCLIHCYLLSLVALLLQQWRSSVVNQLRTYCSSVLKNSDVEAAPLFPFCLLNQCCPGSDNNKARVRTRSHFTNQLKPSSECQCFYQVVVYCKIKKERQLSLIFS